MPPFLFILYKAQLYIQQSVRNFFRVEANSSFVLMVCALAAIIVINTGWEEEYNLLLNWPMPVHFGPVALDKTALLWVNDGLMALFFFVIGLELKYEFVQGHLSNLRAATLPAFGAVGGMLVPGLIFAAFNFQDALAMRGWAIPTATDIAFSLGILLFLGPRVPTGLKIFLLAIAILDDLGAVLIIALYYTENLSLEALMYAAVCLGVLIGMNRLRIVTVLPYLLVGMVMWYFVLISGVHATIAGVLSALTIPTLVAAGRTRSPLEMLQHRMHVWVAFMILPIFAFFNAGIYLLDTTWTDLTSSLTLGIMLGLLLGKPIGICLFTAIAIKLKMGNLPKEVPWPTFIGMSMLCGVGFTMSLFVATLAHGTVPELFTEGKIGIVLGSIFSALIGYLLLSIFLPKAQTAEPPRDAVTS